MSNERNHAVVEEVGRRMEILKRLAAEVPQPPNPRPQEPDADLKRRLFRLKAGRDRRSDPYADRATAIAALEGELEYRRRIRALMEEVEALADMLTSSIQSISNELVGQIMTLFHDAKHLPAASDPDSDVSEFIRKIDRARRASSARK